METNYKTNFFYDFYRESPNPCVSGTCTITFGATKVYCQNVISQAISECIGFTLISPVNHQSGTRLIIYIIS